MVYNSMISQVKFFIHWMLREYRATNVRVLNEIKRMAVIFWASS